MIRRTPNSRDSPAKEQFLGEYGTDPPPAATEAKIELHLETSSRPSEFARSSLGYPPAEEFAAYGEPRRQHMHKDRVN